MRLHSVMLLVAAALLASVDASDSKLSTTRSVTDQNGVSADRFLRTEPITDDEERFSFKVPSSLKNIFKSSTSSKVTSNSKVTSKIITPNVASNVAKEIPDPQAWLQAKVSVGDAFIGLKLDKLEKVEDLIGSPNFMIWFNYVTQFNQKYADDATTVVKSLTTRYQDKKLSEILLAATNSKDRRVKQLGEGLLIGQMDDWFKATKSPHSISNMLGKDELTMPVVDMYAKYFKQATDKAAKKAKAAEAKTKAAAEAKAMAAAAARG